MTLNVLQAFRGNRSALWATTYTFEPGLFDEYLFRQLGEPPLNVNVLVDADRINKVWDEWAEQPWRFRRVNRDYLVRPVHWPGGAFHPKTYLLANKGAGTLLVGSGNLGLRGLLEGNEVFCAFSSTTEVGRAAIGSWRAWMQRIVDEHADAALLERWRELVRSAPWLALPPVTSPFLHNLDRPILDQLVDAIAAPVDELHVLAPFYDADAATLRALIERTAPKELALYLPHDVSISGEKLVDVLREFRGDRRLLGFSEPTFVHAKLIGVVAGGEGLLLSGSPNCSRAALLTSGRAGNSEVAILAGTSAEAVRAAFLPPGWSVVDLREDDLLALAFRSTKDTKSSWSVTLASAAKMADGRIEVAFAPTEAPEVGSVCTATFTLPLAGRRTIEPVPDDATLGAVWLGDSAGRRVSNAVPVEFPQQLRSWLVERSPADDRPKELRPEDLATGVGELLARLNRECVFDIDETPAVVGALRAGDASEGGEDEASGFWERFQADQLRLDYRIARYERLLATDAAAPWFVEDDVYGLLSSMLHRTPDAALRQVSGPDGEPRPSAQPATPQMQVRVGNVLARWSKALNDRRFRWISPQFPVRNYVGLLGAVAECWAKGYVGGDRLTAVTLALLQAFVGSEKRRGYLLGLDDEERARALAALGPDAPPVAAALVYESLYPERDWKARVYEWQPVLVQATELGVIWASPLTSEWLARLPAPGRQAGGDAGTSVGPADVDDHIERLATHTDDRHWSMVQAEELGFTKVAIKATQGAPARTYPITVTVAGVQDLVIEPRVVSLVRRVLQYRRVRGVIIEAAAQGLQRPQRLSVVLGDQAFGMVGPAVWESEQALSTADLASLEAQGRGFEALLRRDESVA